MTSLKFTSYTIQQHLIQSTIKVFLEAVNKVIQYKIKEQKNWITPQLKTANIDDMWFQQDFATLQLLNYYYGLRGDLKQLGLHEKLCLSK